MFVVCAEIGITFSEFKALPSTEQADWLAFFHLRHKDYKAALEDAKKGR